MTKSIADDYAREQVESRYRLIRDLIWWVEDYFDDPEGQWAQDAVKVLRKDYGITEHLQDNLPD